MKQKYLKAVKEEFRKNGPVKPEILNEEDIEHLPLLVRNYLKKIGAVGKEKVVNFEARFKGGIRFGEGEEFMNLRSVQYNFIDNPARLFYIVARRKGIPAYGLHLYRDATAIFKIKVLGLFTVVDAAGPLMDKGETVTVLNDICFMAPQALTGSNITWEEIDAQRVRAIFTNGGITVSAELIFNSSGEMVNFISNDRYETDGKEYRNYPWHTPVVEYGQVNGLRLPVKARLIYIRPEGEFCYGEFSLEKLRYNLLK